MLNVFVSLYSAVASIGTEEAEAKKKKNNYKYLLIQGSEDIILLSDGQGGHNQSSGVILQ